MKNNSTKSRILGKTAYLAGVRQNKGEKEMAEQPTELKKLVAVATDFALAAKLRTKAVELIGNVGNHDALLVLLDLVANEKLTKKERELALKYARGIVRSEY